MEDLFAPPFYAFAGVLLALLFPITVGTIQMNRLLSTVLLISRKADLYFVFANCSNRIRAAWHWILQETVSIHTGWTLW